MALQRLKCLTRKSNVSAFRLCVAALSTKKGKINIQVGDKLPDFKIYENSVNKYVSIHEVFREKKGILFSVVGAFMPGCKRHIPEFVNFFNNYKDEGYTTVACLSVNDPFVMEAWGKDVDPEGKIKMLADPLSEFTRALNCELDSTSLLGNNRSKRYALLIDDNTVTNISNEPDNTGLACLLCIQKMQNPDFNQK